jgi:hypothetical protein
MLRKARIDAPGALHHIIVRGIDRAPPSSVMKPITRTSFYASAGF